MLAKFSRAAGVARAMRVASRAYSGEAYKAVGTYNGYFPNSDMPKHRSDAQSRIQNVPVIEVDGHYAVCDGGAGAMGHPTEWIQLDRRVGAEPAVCKYCGLRYKSKDHSDAQQKANLVANTFP